MSRKTYEKAGRRAETLAMFWLRLKGYRIIEQRYKCHRGEIDIIAQKSGLLVIVEVKQRARLSIAEESLTPTLIRRVSSATDVYISRSPAAQSLAVRYDAIFLIGRWRLHHMKDIWRD